MELSEEQKELSLSLIKGLFEDIEAEYIAGQLDEIIFQFIQDTSNKGYGTWFTDRVWLLLRLRNMFLVLTDGKMFRQSLNH